jgi:hypothetical protein
MLLHRALKLVGQYRNHYGGANHFVYPLLRNQIPPLQGKEEVSSLEAGSKGKFWGTTSC